MANYDKNKLGLVDYFIKQEKYAIYKNKPKNNNNVYLYKVDNKKFQVIKIIDNFTADFSDYRSEDEIIESLRTFLNKKAQRVKLTILSVVFVENRSNIQKEPSGNVVLFVDNNNYFEKLSTYYPEIINLKDDDESDSVTNMSAEEILEDIKNPNSKLTKNLKQLSDKLNLSNLGVTWVLIALLVAIPVVGIFSGNRIFNTANLTQDTISLIYGGVTRDLLVWSNQWWRLWTYILYSANPLMVVINIFLIFTLARYSEAIIGRWKLCVVLIFGIPLTGLFLSAVMPNLIFGGSTPVLALLWGGLFSYNYGKDDLGTLVASKKTVIVPIWLIIMPLFLGYELYVIVLAAFFAGSAIGYLLEFNRSHKVNWSIIYPLFIIVTMGIVAVVTLSISRYVPPLNVPVINMLLSYKNAGLFNLSAIQEMLLKYYSYPKMNWPPSLQPNQILDTIPILQSFLV